MAEFSTAPGVQIFSLPKKQVLSCTTSTPVKPCTSPRHWKNSKTISAWAIRKALVLLPDNGSVSPHRASSLVIVIESNVKTKLRAVATKPPNLDQALLSNYVGDIARAEKLTNTTYDIRNVGYQGHTQRVVIILWARIGIKRMRLTESWSRLRYRRRQYSGKIPIRQVAWRFERPHRQLRRHGRHRSDGLADVLLIDQGDFHGKILLIEKNNQWHKQRDDWGRSLLNQPATDGESIMPILALTGSVGTGKALRAVHLSNAPADVILVRDRLINLGFTWVWWCYQRG
ncbi:MAG: hypothetical protein R3F44_00385 [Candidatus Competibacteraceae bacterium]